MSEQSACEHDWLFQESYAQQGSYKYDDQVYLYDRFYCRKCLAQREVSRGQMRSSAASSAGVRIE